MSIFFRFRWSGQSAQEHRDLVRAYMFAAFRRAHVADARAHTMPTTDADAARRRDEIARVYARLHGEARAVHMVRLRAAVRDMLDEQAEAHLRAAADAGGVDPYPEPRIDDDDDDSNNNAAAATTGNNNNNHERTDDRAARRDTARLDRLRRAYARMARRESSSLDAIVAKRVAHPDGFELDVRRSSIDHPDAGFGLFARGTVLPGTLVAVYPGTTHWPAQLVDDDARRRYVVGNDTLISRITDSCVLDGREWERRAFGARTVSQALGGASFVDALYRDGDGDDAPSSTGAAGAPSSTNADLRRYRLPTALGAYVNHPVAGRQPNCLQLSYDFPVARLPPELAAYVPNAPIDPDAADPLLYRLRSRGIVRSLVLMTTRYVHDEELLLDYRYNPRNTQAHPRWYVPVVAEHGDNTDDEVNLRSGASMRWL